MLEHRLVTSSRPFSPKYSASPMRGGAHDGTAVPLSWYFTPPERVRCTAKCDCKNRPDFRSRTAMQVSPRKWYSVLRVTYMRCWRRSRPAYVFGEPLLFI